MSDMRDERLAAYLDGAMTPEEEALFDHELERDPELARQALQWRANDRFIADVLGPRARAVEPELLARMGLLDAQRPAPVPANDNPWGWRRLVASAAALTLVLGGTLLALRPAGVTPGEDPVSLALESTPSSQGARLADGRVLTPVLTVRAADGRWCREYTLAGEAALACRNAGRWTTEAQGIAGRPAAESGDFAMAGGGETPALEEAYRRIGAQAPLGAEQEAALLDRKWR